MWITTDSLGTKPFNYLSINPLIGNSLLNGGNTPSRYNGFSGINASFNYQKTMLYSQLIFDQKKNWRLAIRH